MARIPVLGTNSDGLDELEALKSHYNQWRQNNTNMKEPFFAVLRAFKDKELLKDLDEGALRLYLYLGFVSNNETGTSWHSIQTIAKYFGRQTRTIDFWIQKLSEAGLIYRTRHDKKSATTFLIPYTDSIINVQPVKKREFDDQELLNDLLESREQLAAVYGEIIKVYHVFHWGLDQKKNPDINASKTNFLFIITKREDGVLVGHRHHLRKSGAFAISQLHVDDVVIFESPFVYKDKPVSGIAVNHMNRLRQKDSIETLMNMMRDLAVADDEILLQHPTAIYGLIEEGLEVEEDGEEDPTETDEGGED
ncbi:Helix-turn-helix domain-containing protein [Paenibacillus tianmuensis]|uniref:Helix-turn-helix domain-containing protein n=1 Tax=Paenibacillus tianmuensis TaxID=624147 RepID=A0A1G4TT79_9BACL|nr:helix-turn-helix domain-containing protein [Paenibacillus tianmuensis]SCW83945.1 Helix-turn-helix domain-containing protein [Paenibacillus tianmuensis]